MSLYEPTTSGGFCSRHGAYHGLACPRCDTPAQLAPKPPVAPAGKPPSAPRHARLILDYTENGTPRYSAEGGMAVIDGGWVLWLQDGADVWQSWPARNVVRVDWV